MKPKKESPNFFVRQLANTYFVIFMAVLALLAANPRPALPGFPGGDTNGLVICIPVWAEPLDPTDHRSRVVQIVLKNMFDSLTTRNDSLQVVPQLAESWRIVSDTSWEFEIRKGVRFHNGDELTAEDVKFTLDLVTQKGALDGRTSPRRGLFKPISKTEVLGRYRVRIETTKPWPVLPLMLSLQEIVPKKYMTSVGLMKFRQHPIGTGPFKFLGTEGRKRIILERFNRYYGGSPRILPVQPARLRYLVFRAVPSKAEQVALLKAGECDIVANLPPESIPIITSTPGLKVFKTTATISYFAEINCKKPPWDDRRVRQALNLCVDMRAVVNYVLKGYGVELPTVLLPNAFSYDASLKPYPYDPGRAAKLLGDSNFPKHRTISIHCIGSQQAFAGSLALFLTKAGLKPKITVEPGFRPRAFGKRAKWDLHLGRWGNSTLDPVGILPPKFRTGARGNHSGYSNPEVDELFSLAEKTLDHGVRKVDYEKVQRIIYRDAPMIFGFAPDEFYGVRKRVKNFKPTSSGMIVMHDVYVD